MHIDNNASVSVLSSFLKLDFFSLPTFHSGPRLYRISLAWLAFSAPLGYCIFHNTTATLYYLSDSIAALLDIFWFLPWLRSVLEYLLLMPYRILCVLTGGGYYEEAWRKVLEILLKEYTEREKEALQVMYVVCGNIFCTAFNLFHHNLLYLNCRYCLWEQRPLLRR